jgi:hypothetical protein
LLAETVSSTGTLLAVEAVDLQAEVSGKITAITFHEGAHVARGDLLVKLNDADLQARRAGAVHQLELAETREQRASDLLTQGFVIQDAHDGAVATAQCAAPTSPNEAEIAKTEIRARSTARPVCATSARARSSARPPRSRRCNAPTRSRSTCRPSVTRRRSGWAADRVHGRRPPRSGLAARSTPTIRIDPETRRCCLRALPEPRRRAPAFANVRLVLAEVQTRC